MDFVKDQVMSIDNFSKPPGLKIKGKDKAYTLSGVLVTLLVVAALIAYVAYSIAEYFRYQPVGVNELIEPTKGTPIDMIADPTARPYLAFYSGYDVVDPETIADYLTVRFETNQVRFNSSLSRHENYNLQIPFTPCSSQDQGPYKEFLNPDHTPQNNINFFKKALCLDFSQITEKEINLTSQTILNQDDLGPLLGYVYIEPCTIEASSACAARSAAESEDLINGLTVYVGNINLFNKPNDYKNPIGKAIEFLNYYFLMPSIDITIDVKYGTLEVQNDGLSLSGAQVAQRSSMLENTRQIISSRDKTVVQCNEGADCTTLLTLALFNGHNKRIISREYKGVLDYLGSIGGIKEIFFIGGAVLYKLFMNRFEKDEMVFQVYGLKAKNKKKKKNSCCRKSKRAQEEEEKEHEPTNGDQVPDSGSYIDKDGFVRVEDSVIDVAYESIQRTLDVRWLVEDLNKLRLLISVMLRDLPDKAYQEAYLNIFYEEHLKEELEAENKKKKEQEEKAKKKNSKEAKKHKSEIVSNQAGHIHEDRLSVNPKEFHHGVSTPDEIQLELPNECDEENKISPFPQARDNFEFPKSSRIEENDHTKLNGNLLNQAEKLEILPMNPPAQNEQENKGAFGTYLTAMDSNSLHSLLGKLRKEIGLTVATALAMSYVRSTSLGEAVHRLKIDNTDMKRMHTMSENYKDLSRLMPAPLKLKVESSKHHSK